jgi:hypothetical protein
MEEIKMKGSVVMERLHIPSRPITLALMQCNVPNKSGVER